MPDVLMFADTVRSPEMRHEVPVPGARPASSTSSGTALGRCSPRSLELPRLAEVDGLEAISFEEIGQDELVAAGMQWHDLDLGARAARLPPRGRRRARSCRGTFRSGSPTTCARTGSSSSPTGSSSISGAGPKTEAEIAGIRKAAARLRAGDGPRARAARRRRRPTCEELRAEILRIFTEDGLTAPDGLIVSHGAQTAVGHEPGHGKIVARRAGRRRPLPAGSRVGLLHGHDAHLLRRRAARRARRVSTGSAARRSSASCPRSAPGVTGKHLYRI